ncbi:chemotaxis protein CheA [Bermanella marisrubri]|uniref:Chemotaxis protein CheA n=1 Tax=Bermanella marisrubri TaxID=207949 RepID=Q1N2W7_9GAMM|nr:chemotaxis protein CheA [Bermanella marisrubri]EAT12552.1 CheA signal transduction histidine kinase [Oceanobacter sp. RED65] [Bermanella marisrubri]QIZ84890.1 chemotaxis protein CheA [Bermanella marisrubri]
MSIDLSQFHQVFFEESYEGLDIMENGLLQLDVNAPDAEEINTIFRAAHSIKGGAGTFGFTIVSDFTHVVETLLDEVRDGKRSLDQGSQDLLLKSVDCIRSLLEALQAGSTPDTNSSDELKQKFETLLSSGSSPNPAVSSDDGGSSEEPPKANGWKVLFKPQPHLLMTGNEPVRMFRQLIELSDGQYHTEVNIEKLPSFTSLDPEQCFLSWTLYLHNPVEKTEIEEVFEWVLDDAEVVIEAWSENLKSEIEEQTEKDEATSSDGPVQSSETDSLDKTLSSEDSKEVTKASGPDKVAVKAAPAKESSSIRVSIDKVDSLINMVGELVITQSMLGQLGENFDASRIQNLQEGLAQLEQNTRELQESVMKIRMMPISFVFSRFPRLVRDVSVSLNKRIELVMSGEHTELDKTVMEKIGDPMVHLIRNSIDHGIELPEIRKQNGKPETGTVELNAYHQSGNIVIEIKDDGAGLNKEKILEKAILKGIVDENQNLNDEQIFDLIFQPGFSTADQVSDLSGRGVGMDVVRRNIASLNGSIEVKSETGKGSQFIIRLPLTLAILDGQLVRVGEQTFIFPLVSIVESIQQNELELNNVGGQSDVLKLRDEYVPIVALHQVFDIQTDNKVDEDEKIIVVVESDGEKIGIVVDELLAQQQVVIKSLEENYQKVEGISGATILGDGRVALIVDISGLSKLSGASNKTIESNRHQAA